MQTSKNCSLIGKKGSSPVQNNITVTKVRLIEKNKGMLGFCTEQRAENSGGKSAAPKASHISRAYFAATFLRDNVAEIAPNCQMFALEFLDQLRSLKRQKKRFF